MTALASYGEVERLALLIGLSLFFGFAFEDFYAGTLPHRPGGVRTFPLLALAGGGLYLIEPHSAAPFVAGLLILGAWIYAYVRAELEKGANAFEGLFIVPVCNLLAYLLGPLALTQPLWICVAVAVAAVMLLGSRRLLHDWAQRVPAQEIITAGQFLILVGVILPLLAGRPTIPYTTITPFGVWLAVVAVSSISYASYLLECYSPLKGGTLWSSILGGLYSSTATTVVLARRARDSGMTGDLGAGILAASGMMYVRIAIVVALFDLPLASLLALPLVALAAASGLFAAFGFRARTDTAQAEHFANPLQLTTALIFALLFVGVAMLATFAEHAFGRAGIFALAGIVGVTDIDPFVLSLAQGGAAMVSLPTAAAAILIAASSNDVLKAIYTIAFSRRKESALPAAMLILLAVAGLAVALLAFR